MAEMRNCISHAMLCCVKKVQYFNIKSKKYVYYVCFRRRSIENLNVQVTWNRP